MPIFECRALEKRYGAAMALDHIDLALEPGRIVGSMALTPSRSRSLASSIFSRKLICSSSFPAAFG